MKKYWISGSLPAPWEDFFPVDKGNAHAVTITADESLKDGELVLEPEEGDGWLDLRVKELTLETTKKALAKVNGVAPCEVQILQKGSCVSI